MSRGHVTGFDARRQRQNYRMKTRLEYSKIDRRATNEHSLSLFRRRSQSSHRIEVMAWGKLRIGEYPAEYDRAIHGPYDPARWYGKPDTPFGQVKIGEFLPWLSRRNKSPSAIVAAASRSWWRWQHKYIHPKRAGIAPYYQIIVGSMIFFYVINYGKIKHHRNYKYH